jgi:hypothetical protein
MGAPDDAMGWTARDWIAKDWVVRVSIRIG